MCQYIKVSNLVFLRICINKLLKQKLILSTIRSNEWSVTNSTDSHTDLQFIKTTYSSPNVRPSLMAVCNISCITLYGRVNIRPQVDDFGYIFLSVKKTSMGFMNPDIGMRSTAAQNWRKSPTFIVDSLFSNETKNNSTSSIAFSLHLHSKSMDPSTEQIYFNKPSSWFNVHCFSLFTKNFLKQQGLDNGSGNWFYSIFKI